MSFGENAHGAGYFTGEVASYREINRAWPADQSPRGKALRALQSERTCLDYSLYLHEYVTDAERTENLRGGTFQTRYGYGMRIAQEIVQDVLAHKALRAAAESFLRVLYAATAAGHLEREGVATLADLENYDNEYGAQPRSVD